MANVQQLKKKDTKKGIEKAIWNLWKVH